MLEIASAKLLKTSRVRGNETRTVVPVTAYWATRESDWRLIRYWGIISSTDPRSADAIEYSTLASERWRYFDGQNFIARSISEIVTRSQEEPDTDLGFGILLSGNSRSAYGCCFARRTFCNNILLEYLSAAPYTSDTITGVGTVLVQLLGLLGQQWGASELWGECTSLSNTFYSRLQTKIDPSRSAFKDRFVFKISELAALAETNGNPTLH